MKRCATILALVVVFFGFLSAEDRISLPYEDQTIDEIAGTVLGVPTFGEKSYLDDLTLLSVRFPAGTSRDEVYRELVSLKKRFLYCTDVYTSKDTSLSFRVFHYPKDHDGIYERSIMFQFQFDDDGKLISCSYYQRGHKYGGEPNQPAEPTALAPAAIESRARNLSLAARLAHG